MMSMVAEWRNEKLLMLVKEQIALEPNPTRIEEIKCSTEGY